MRFSRIGWGIVAGVAAVAAMLVVQAVETRLFGAPRRRTSWAVFFGTGCAILWLADRFGLMASPFTEPALGLGSRDGSARDTPGETPLESFLKAGDLDELLHLRGDISRLTPEESSRIASIIHDWTDRQAIANLLFHPDLIPADVRFEALDRALRSNEVPYFVLAASVGLQQVSPDDVPADKRIVWVQTLLRLVRSQSPVLAGRASVTLYEWMRGIKGPDVMPELVSSHPVADEGACRNIAAAVLARYGELSPADFDRRLTEWRVSDAARTALRRAHDEYCHLKTHDAFRARLLTMPALAYIPNLSEIDDDQ